MKKLVLLSLVFVFPLIGMQGKRPASAVPEMAAESSPAQKQKIEKEQAEAMSAEKSTFERLPNELKQIILKFLTKAPGRTNEIRLQAAVNNIHNFMTQSKAFAPFLKDMLATEWIIKELARRYTHNNLIRAAIALHTDVAGQWLANYVGNNNEKRGELNVFLAEAARLQELDEVEFILKYLPSVVNGKTLNGATALMFAAENGDQPMVNYLLEIPVIDITLKSAWGSTALMFAAKNGFLAIVEQLLAKSAANINVQNQNGSTALILAAQNGHPEVVKRLLQVPGINVNLRTRQGYTALMFAAIAGYKEIVEQLLAVPGINVNLVPQGKTAVGMVREFSQSPHKDAVIKLLLDHGAVE